jgi:hypothetical protein
MTRKVFTEPLINCSTTIVMLMISDLKTIVREISKVLLKSFSRLKAGYLQCLSLDLLARPWKEASSRTVN